MFFGIAGLSGAMGQTLDKSWHFSNFFAANDTTGQTHLFYELVEKRKYICSDLWGSRVYNTSYGNIRHMNPARGTDSTFMNAGGIGGIGCDSFDGWINIADFHPFDNNFENFIFVGSFGDGFEPYAYSQIGTQQYYLAPLFDYFGRVEANPYLGKFFFLPKDNHTVQVPITTNSDSIEYIRNYWHEIADEEAASDSILNILDFKLLSLSTFNDSLAFIHQQNSLIRSEDLGTSGDTLSIQISSDSQFLFDSDSLHIYTTSNTGNLLVSNNYGKQGSWMEFPLQGNPLTLQVDPQKAGHLYVADSTAIYESTDFGQSFQKVYSADHFIVDFYHKPASDIYYVLQKEQIIEVSTDSVSILKSVPDISGFEMNIEKFPYRDGNEFVFTVMQKDPEDDSEYYDVLTLEEFKTTTTREENGNESVIHFNDESDYPLFKELRLDSLSNLIATDWVRDSIWTLMDQNKPRFKTWQPIPEKDSIIVKALFGDNVTTRINGNTFDQGISLVFYSEQVRETGTFFNDAIASAQWSPKVGFTYFRFGVHGLIYYLKGAKIDGITYGNMTVVSNEPEPSNIPSQITLGQNYPNPFNPSTVISYQLDSNQLVRLEVFDVTGRKVATLVDGQRLSAGSHRASFDASGLSSGVYFYRLETGGQTLTRKMLLVK
ncbi:Por secretion system C-terminal sorting domain-containing protein [Gracilimonas mengyeensis]|uniref:Por secretion system C-terminal sorting domain-containing protein n=2 Tax=Gracilimonas mengyeensis TaxID=1302730 RepID=A0A521C7Y9_9BACT|nr:Por secretion system C-terminal sorting domain-containing protein [Gracilimonas mengyeensis]